MKKVLLILAAMASLVCSCKKTAPEDTSMKPSIIWANNESFARWEIKENIVKPEEQVVVTVPEGIATLKISATIPDKLRVLCEKMIGISANKKDGQPLVFDLIEDKTAVNNLVTVGLLSSANISSPCTLTFDYLLSYLMTDVTLANGSKFDFEVQVTDKAGSSAKKTAAFNWTSAPEIEMNPQVESITLSDEGEFKYKAVIAANGKINTVTLLFETEDKADAGLVAYLTKAFGEDMAIELVAEPTVAKRAGMDYGSMQGATSAEIDLEGFLDQLSLVASGGGTTTRMKFIVEDELGKTRSASVKLLVP